MQTLFNRGLKDDSNIFLLHFQNKTEQAVDV